MQRYGGLAGRSATLEARAGVEPAITVLQIEDTAGKASTLREVASSSLKVWPGVVSFGQK